MEIIFTDELLEIEEVSEDPYSGVTFGCLNLAGVELALGIADDQAWAP
jgi:hypothetical protein